MLRLNVPIGSNFRVPGGMRPGCRIVLCALAALMLFGLEARAAGRCEIHYHHDGRPDGKRCYDQRGELQLQIGYDDNPQSPSFGRILEAWHYGADPFHCVYKYSQEGLLSTKSCYNRDWKLSYQTTYDDRAGSITREQILTEARYTGKDRLLSSCEYGYSEQGRLQEKSCYEGDQLAYRTRYDTDPQSRTFTRKLETARYAGSGLLLERCAYEYDGYRQYKTCFDGLGQKTWYASYDDQADSLTRGKLLHVSHFDDYGLESYCCDYHYHDRWLSVKSCEDSSGNWQEITYDDKDDSPTRGKMLRDWRSDRDDTSTCDYSYSSQALLTEKDCDPSGGLPYRVTYDADPQSPDRGKITAVERFDEWWKIASRCEYQYDDGLLEKISCRDGSDHPTYDATYGCYSDEPGFGKITMVERYNAEGKIAYWCEYLYHYDGTFDHEECTKSPPQD